MPLYELVLRFPDREETRFTDRPVTVGGAVSIGKSLWEVIASTDARSPSSLPVEAAFVCEPAVDPG